MERRATTPGTAGVPRKIHEVSKIYSEAFFNLGLLVWDSGKALWYNDDLPVQVDGEDCLTEF